MKRIIKNTLLVVLLTLGVGAWAVVKPLDVTVCDFYKNPLGYNLSDLSFSWKLPPVRNGMAQSAYQIVVAKDE